MEYEETTDAEPLDGVVYDENGLLPCPHCGGKAKVFVYTGDMGGLCIKCMDCYCQTNIDSDFCISDCKRQSAFERAVKAWNRRA